MADSEFGVYLAAGCKCVRVFVCTCVCVCIHVYTSWLVCRQCTREDLVDGMQTIIFVEVDPGMV